MVEDKEIENERILLGSVPTEDDLAFFQEATFQMRKANAIRKLGNRRMSERERSFWERQKMIKDNDPNENEMSKM